MFFDEFTNTFLAGIGCDLYQISNTQSKHLVKCGEVSKPVQDDKKSENKAEGAAFISGIASNDHSMVVINNNKLVEVFDGQFQKVASVVVCYISNGYLYLSLLGHVFVYLNFDQISD